RPWPAGGTGERRLMAVQIQVAERARVGLRRETSAFDSVGFLRRLDWVLLAAAFALIGYGLWVVGGITRFDVPGDPNYYVVRQAVPAFPLSRARGIMRWRTIMSAIGLGAVPILLVFLQPYLGTALVYSAALFSLLFFVGVRWRQLLVLFVAATFLALAVLWVLPAS